jgi:hypothetical protein
LAGGLLFRRLTEKYRIPGESIPIDDLSTGNAFTDV